MAKRIFPLVVHVNWLRILVKIRTIFLVLTHKRSGVSCLQNVPMAFSILCMCASMYSYMGQESVERDQVEDCATIFGGKKIKLHFCGKSLYLF
jgi:hypothetical protein